MFAAACGLHKGNAGASRRALLPIGLGHAASVALVALAVSQGMRLDMDTLRRAAGAMLLALAAFRLIAGTSRHTPIGVESSTTGMAFWSFLISSAQGSGLMLVPALVPMCLAASPARATTASGSVLLALGAVAVHAGAMLIATGVLAQGAYRAGSAKLAMLDSRLAWHAWTAALFTTGAVLAGLGSTLN